MGEDNKTVDKNLEDESKEDIRENHQDSAVQDILKSMGIKLRHSKKCDIKKASVDSIGGQDNRNKADDIAKTTEKDKEVDTIEIAAEQHKENAGEKVTSDLELDESSEEGILKTRWFKRKLLVFPILVLIAFLVFKILVIVTAPKPPSENVVATYSGKNITKEDLMSYIRSKGYKEEEHELCDKHGFDHSKCDKSETCETHPIDSMEGYKQIVAMMAVEKITDDWAKEKGVTQKKEVDHSLKHLIEEVNLDQLVSKLHEDELSPEKIDKSEVQKYYDENKDKYKDKPFNEVEEEIRLILAQEKDKQFFPQYIEKIRKNTALNVNYDLLKVEEPTDTEMRDYYEKNKNQYIEPSKIKILEIKLDISGSEDDARRKAEEAFTKIKSGEKFEDVAPRYYSKFQSSGTYVKQGERGSVFEDRVFNLQVNELSTSFKDGNSYFVVKVIEKLDKRQKSFAESLNEIRSKVYKDKEDKQYELKKSQAIFSVHGKTFTLGEFKEEFRELSPEIQNKYGSFEAKKNLIDEMIIKELLLEEAGDEVSDKENKEQMEDIKRQYIRQILHKEEIDEKIGEISDDEAKKFYDKNNNSFIEPPKAKISLITIGQGTSDAEKKRARQRIDEAYQKLKGGVDFSTVAREYSKDITAMAGGAINQWLYNDGHLEPVLKENIFKLKVNDISEIFESHNSFIIIKLNQKEDKVQKSFDEVKSHIKEELREEKHIEKTKALQDELLKKSNLIIYDSSLKQLLKEQKKSNEGR